MVVQALGLQGKPPAHCTPAIMRTIVRQHLQSPSILAIFPMQASNAFSQVQTPYAASLSMPCDAHTRPVHACTASCRLSRTMYLLGCNTKGTFEGNRSDPTVWWMELRAFQGSSDVKISSEWQHESIAVKSIQNSRDPVSGALEIWLCCQSTSKLQALQNVRVWRGCPLQCLHSCDTGWSGAL